MSGPIILQPVVSEKSFTQSENAVYTFRVSPDSNKKQVKQEVEKLFKVTVEKVRILNRKGKRVFDLRRRIHGKRKGHKRAIVTLKSGDTIDLFT